MLKSTAYGRNEKESLHILSNKTVSFSYNPSQFFLFLSGTLKKKLELFFSIFFIIKFRISHVI